MHRLKKYYELAKPGIIYGNLLTTVAGFLFAWDLGGRGGRVGEWNGWNGGFLHFNFELFFVTVIGTALVIGSACVCNNYTDRAIDVKMSRTKGRVLVQGSVSGRNALIYATVLGISGILILAFYTNAVTTSLEIFGLFSYVVLYGIAKRRTIYGVLVGTLPGAVPVAAGYCAVTGRFDIPALVLFIILVLWQMPHFYAIALYRADEYRAANIPILPLKKGIRRTKTEMLAYTLLFFAAVLWLGIVGHNGHTGQTGYAYFAVMTVAALGWVCLAVKGFFVTDTAYWARRMFFYSLILIVIFSIMISV